jgi:hypothetical protein
VIAAEEDHEPALDAREPVDTDPEDGASDPAG